MMDVFVCEMFASALKSTSDLLSVRKKFVRHYSKPEMDEVDINSIQAPLYPIPSTSYYLLPTLNEKGIVRTQVLCGLVQQMVDPSFIEI